MLPALPTGIARTSGARPRSSQTSNAPVFWPSSRNGLTELTSVIGCSSCSDSARTTRSASSKLPRTEITRAPNTSAWSSLPTAILPAGSTTTHSSPAAAAYAAAEADVLPVEAQITLRAPSSSALATARTIPRSLKLPVGFWPSTLKYRLAQPERLAEAARVDERRRALAERDDRRRVGDGQELAVALDELRAGVAGRGHGRPSRRLGSRRRTAPRRILTRRGARRSPTARSRRGSPPTSSRARARSRRGRRAPPTRSPAPPAPGPSNATRPTGSASTSTRLSTPSQRPNGDPAGTAVGTTDASMRAVLGRAARSR